MKRTPDNFYREFLQRLAASKDVDIATLEHELRESRAGRTSRLNYIVRQDFDLAAAVGEGMVDLVFSQAAFEHFDDVEATFGRMMLACKPGALLIAEIDLQTHTRWIRDKDPNSIYRYSDRI